VIVVGQMVRKRRGHGISPSAEDRLGHD